MASDRKSTNVTPVEHRISYTERIRRSGHRGGVLWFTGLPGAGKSTLALETEAQLFHQGYQVYALDGDNLRHGLNADLGFSHEHRTENIRRVGEVAALLGQTGFIVIAAFISPYAIDRQKARQATLREIGLQFHEIYIHADLKICESRDPKGLYKKARNGEIADFTGISAPYEIPKSPDLVIDTSHQDVGTCVEQLTDYVKAHFTTP